MSFQKEKEWKKSGGILLFSADFEFLTKKFAYVIIMLHTHGHRRIIV